MTRPTRRRRLRILAVTAGALVLAAGTVSWVHRDFLFRRFAAVREGVLYRSQLLDAETLRGKVERHGIRTIVNLTHQQEADMRVAEETGARYVWLHSEQVPRPEITRAFLAILDDPANHPVLVHCQHGSGRTGVMAALFRMEYEGWSAEDAIREARLYSHYGSFMEGTPKAEYLRHYVPRSARADEAMSRSAAARAAGAPEPATGVDAP
jgi:protein tyrosine/serine phosphatase